MNILALYLFISSNKILYSQCKMYMRQLNKKNISPEILKSIREREMKTEHLINIFRVSFISVLMSIEFINIVLGTYRKESLVFEISFTTLMFFIILFVHFACKRKKYIAWLKYLTVSLDIVSSFVYAYFAIFILKFEVPGGAVTFLLISSFVFLFFNSLSVIRSNRNVIIYSGIITLSFNALLYVLAGKTTMPVYYTSVFIIIFTVMNVWISGHIINFFVVNNKLNVAYDDIKKANIDIKQRNDEISAQRDEIQTQKNKVERYSKNITDSIKYAKKIQRAVLPSDNFMQKEFNNDYFVFYRPRDIVSGDFYWAKKIEKKIIIIVADCTGHGVPGAFVSMLGISFLNEIFLNNKIADAASILNDLRDKVKASFKQKGRREEQKDGMDISLCMIDTDTYQFEYAGAFNPLYIMLNEDRETLGKRITELEKLTEITIHYPVLISKTQSLSNTKVLDSRVLVEIKGDRQPIGVHKAETPFANKKGTLKKGDTIFMFSDGYIDQFKSNSEEKMKLPRFRNLLYSVSDNPMQEQKSIIEKVFDEWKGEGKQVDDVLVIGIKI